MTVADRLRADCFSGQLIENAQQVRNRRDEALSDPSDGELVLEVDLEGLRRKLAHAIDNCMSAHETGGRSSFDIDDLAAEQLNPGLDGQNRFDRVGMDGPGFPNRRAKANCAAYRAMQRMLLDLLGSSRRATGCQPGAHLNANLSSDALGPLGVLGLEDDRFIASDVGDGNREQGQTADCEAAHMHFRKGSAARIGIQYRNAGKSRHEEWKKPVLAADLRCHDRAKMAPGHLLHGAEGSEYLLRVRQALLADERS